MKSLPIPTGPGKELEKQRYLVTVCHFSNWIEVDKLEDSSKFFQGVNCSAREDTPVIDKTKAHFARYGVPAICHTDNGHSLSVKTTGSSLSNTDLGIPRHPLTALRVTEEQRLPSKLQLRKADDFHSTMLVYKNTPPQGHTYSPA